MVIRNKLSWFFTPPMRFAGGFLCIAGIFPLFYGEYAASLLIIIGMGIISLHSAIYLDTAKKKYKLYYKLFWSFTFGKYHTFNTISEVNLKTKNLAYSTFSRSNRQVENRFTNYLVSATINPSEMKIPLFISKNRALAESKAKEYESVKS
jgi:hypothetical protein